MAYYLSKTNRSLVELLALKLKDKDVDYEMSVNQPQKLERIVRSACILEEFKWIKEKFVVSARSDKIVFSVKQLVMGEFIEPAYIVEQEADLFFVINVLLLQKKDKVEFIRCVLTDDELDGIKLWCDNHEYKAIYEDEILKVEKKHGE